MSARQLTEVGFKFACSVELRRFWPDVTPRQAVDWLMDSIDVPVGTPGYDWSGNGAKELARLYVEEFGEVGQ